MEFYSNVMWKFTMFAEANNFSSERMNIIQL